MKFKVGIELDVGLNKKNTAAFVAHCFETGLLNSDVRYLLKRFPNLKTKIKAKYHVEKGNKE